jgi:hypothetical protein
VIRRRTLGGGGETLEDLSFNLFCG